LSVVLDASAVLAYLKNEPGAEAVYVAVGEGALVSAVNWAEALSKLAEGGQDPGDAARALTDIGILGQGLIVRPLDGAQAVEIARLRPLIREAGLSLGDRACLALAGALGLPALTADHVWARLNLGLEVRLIR
jgi:ribonuclease VapC